MSRPGYNRYMADTKDIEAGESEDFTFAVDDGGFVWRQTDFEVDQEAYHNLTTILFHVTDVKRKFAAGDDEVSMGTGNIPLQSFCRRGNSPNLFLYEEPVKGNSKIIIKVTNDDQEKHELTIIVWGAPLHGDPYYVRPEDWPKITPFKVVKIDGTE